MAVKDVHPQNAEGGPMDMRQALSMNRDAQVRFMTLMPAQQQRFLHEGNRCKTREEQMDMINTLAGWVDPHPPYQL